MDKGMESTPDIVVLGHHGCGANVVRVHHIPLPGETITAWDSKHLKDGGKGSHQAIVISRMGGHVAFIGKIGTDEQSEASREWLVEDGVNIKHLLRGGRKEPQAGLIMVDDEGVNSIVSVKGVRHTLTFDEVKPCLEDFKSAKMFITGFEIPLKTALDSARLAKQLGMFVILNPAPASEEPLGTLEYVDVIIPNETEAKSLIGIDLHDEMDPQEMSGKIMERYKVGSVIITLGGKGAFGYDGRESWMIPSIPVHAVDTIGAGDSFIGGFSWALSNGKKFPEAMEWGNYVAALSVSREGSIDSFPYLKEVKTFMAEHPVSK
jgi:ribokinase